MKDKTKSKPKKKNRPKKGLTLSRSDITSLIALLISIGAFIVSLYEARILREQQELMQLQQETSVYPHIEILKAVKYQEEQVIFEVKVFNHGTGIAIVKNQTVYLRGVEQSDNLSPILEGYGAAIQLSNNLTNDVIPAGAEELIFSFAGNAIENEKRFQELYQNFSVELCYHSIFNKYWNVSTEGDGFPTDLNLKSCKK